MYAHVVEGAILSVGPLPEGLAGLPVGDQEAAGYFLVTPTALDTDDPANPTWQFAVEMVNGAPTQVWYSVVSNQAAIETNLAQDLLDILAILDDTNANINANPAARIKTVCRAMRRVIRHELQKYDGTG